MRTSRVLETIARRIEAAQGLDAVADRVQAVVRKAVSPSPVKEVLSGTPVGHPVHPLMVSLPIGAWTSAILMDATGNRDAARKLIAAGVVTALPTAATGASDWAYTGGAERRVGLVHAALNYGAIGLYAASWRARATGAHTRGVVLSAAGAGLLGVGGWLGGHLSFAQGVGVDTTAFQQFPTEWTDAIGVDDVPAPGELTHVEVAGVPVLLIGGRNGLTAMADRCTHRGAPLHDGELVDGCVVCPWHGGSFDIEDGHVTAGPATRPQPMLEVRRLSHRVQVRRAENRALRINPVGH